MTLNPFYRIKILFLSSAILLSTFLCLKFSAIASEPTTRCTDLLLSGKTQSTLLPSGLLVEKTAITYRAVDPKFKDYSATGTLSFNGTLYLDFKLKEDFRRRSPLLRGKEQFDAIMAHFGDHVQQINGVWVEGDNLDIVNEYTSSRHRFSLLNAARKTWTAQQAFRHGFTVLTVIDTEGLPGRYSEILVNFRRPSDQEESP